MGPRLNTNQREALVEIHLLGPILISDLAFNLVRTQSATRSAVKRLAARGLVDHTEVTYSARGLAWFTTDAGDAAALEIDKAGS
jgi:DNA-binding MarR family transcriptional regulator